MPFAPKLPYPVTPTTSALSTVHPSAARHPSTNPPTAPAPPQATSPAAHSLLKASITNYAKSLGFDLVGFCKPKIEQKYLDALESWVKKGCAADMQYMKDSEKLAARSDLSKVLPGVKSVITLGVNYYYDQPPLKRGYGRVARYAAGRDYHKVIGKMLKNLVKFLEQIDPDKNHRHKAYVDTGPILERALAEQSGIGQIGKNALIISREFGSWIFLAEVLTTIDLGFSSASASPVPGDVSPAPLSVGTSAQTVGFASVPGDVSPAPASSSISLIASTSPISPASPLHKKTFGLCGQCTKCIQACPTGAIIAPGVVDSRLCISYLTIENRKKIPAHLAKKIKKTRRLFGCDICQEVCPHNEAKQKPVSGDVFASLAATTAPTQNPSKPVSRKFAKQISLPPAPEDVFTPGSPTSYITTSAPVVANDLPSCLPGTPLQSTKLITHDSQNPQPLDQLSLKKILGIKSEQKFRICFSSTALMRTKLKGLKRNARAIKTAPAHARARALKRNAAPSPQGPRQHQ